MDHATTGLRPISSWPKHQAPTKQHEIWDLARNDIRIDYSSGPSCDPEKGLIPFLFFVFIILP